jgi:hypothetical protein
MKEGRFGRQKAESIVQLSEVNIIACDYSEYRLCFQGKLLEVLGMNIRDSHWMSDPGICDCEYLKLPCSKIRHSQIFKLGHYTSQWYSHSRVQPFDTWMCYAACLDISVLS